MISIVHLAIDEEYSAHMIHLPNDIDRLFDDIAEQIWGKIHP